MQLKKKIILLHPKYQRPLEFETGVCWKAFWIGPLEPFFREDDGYATLYSLLVLVSFGAFWFVGPFWINKARIGRALRRGFVPATESDKESIRLLKLTMRTAQPVFGTSIQRLGSLDNFGLDFPNKF